MIPHHPDPRRVLLVYPAVINDPDGERGRRFSLFPFTSPLLMFLRTAVSEPPAWQILLSIASRSPRPSPSPGSPAAIYRVGILMYGKKPTIPEILRWVRYSPGKTAQPGMKSHPSRREHGRGGRAGVGFQAV